MKVSLWKDIWKYSRTKDIVPLDERQMDMLKDLYFELAKTLILSFMVFMIAYGYMEMRGEKADLGYLSLAMSMLGCITYYYTLRFCYQSVIGMDVNFEVLLIPAFVFTPFLFLHTIALGLSYLDVSLTVYNVLYCTFPIVFILLYLGANKVYQNGKKAMEKEMQEGELHFRSRRQIVNYIIIAAILLCVLPIDYNQFFQIGMLLCCLFIIYNILHYGFTNPQNDYVLNEQGVTYYKALWGKKGGFIAYEDIKDVMVQDTFNIGYAKDKVRICCTDGKNIYLYPENAFRFYTEIKNII